ncbi:MAG: hypothetical protein ACJ8AI_26905 [Rhodopila sp.]
MTRTSEHRELPPAQWPAADRRTCDAAIRPNGFLEDAGKGAAWRTASRRSAQGTYGRWLAWLTSTGVDLEGEAPAARITPDRMQSYVRFQERLCSSVTVASYLGVMCMLVSAMFPAQNWRWLQALQRRLHRKASPSRDKKNRLVPARDLHQLGLELMDTAWRLLNEPTAMSEDRRRVVAAARNYRDGLIISLLALRPLRVKNLLEINIGTHLKKEPSGHVLAFNADETKTKRSLRFSYPSTLEKALSYYLARVRPIRIDADAPGAPARINRPAAAKLWIAQGGTPMTAGALKKALARHTLRRFGRILNAHLFRDCAATTLANQDPNNVRYAAQLLGHTGLRTTEKSYIALDSLDSLVRHHDLISAMRRTGRKKRKAG